MYFAVCMSRNIIDRFLLRWLHHFQSDLIDKPTKLQFQSIWNINTVWLESRNIASQPREINYRKSKVIIKMQTGSDTMLLRYYVLQNVTTNKSNLPFKLILAFNMNLWRSLSFAYASYLILILWCTKRTIRSRCRDRCVINSSPSLSKLCCLKKRLLCNISVTELEQISSFWLLPGTWSHLWFTGVHEYPPWCSIVDATVTVHQFFCFFTL